jgi:hypothetical protein
MVTPEIITAVTKNIMPIKPAGTRPARRLRIWSEGTRIVAGLALGLALIWLAMPRTMAAFSNLPGDPVLRAMQSGQPVTGDDLHGFIASREHALEWIDAGRAWTDLGLAYINLAKQAGYNTKSGRINIEQGAKAVEAGLSKTPANAYAWARLTFLNLRRNDRDVDARNSLVLSLFTGPYERSLAHTRIQYGLAVWHSLNASQQALVHDQIVFLDRFDRRRLHQIVRKNRNLKVIALTALANYPERQTALRAALKN